MQKVQASGRDAVYLLGMGLSAREKVDGTWENVENVFARKQASASPSEPRSSSLLTRLRRGNCHRMRTKDRSNDTHRAIVAFAKAARTWP